VSSRVKTVNLLVLEILLELEDRRGLSQVTHLPVDTLVLALDAIHRLSQGQRVVRIPWAMPNDLTFTDIGKAAVERFIEAGAVVVAVDRVQGEHVPYLASGASASRQ
jgi:hypothetical protein